MRDFDPAEAAAMAEGADPDDVAAQAAGQAAEIDPDAAPEPTPEPTPADTAQGGMLTTLKDALMQTEPATALDRIESPWQPELGEARMKRGIQKMSGLDGTPAVVDLAIGAAETFVHRAEGGQ